MPTLPPEGQVGPYEYLILRKFQGIDWRQRHAPPGTRLNWLPTDEQVTQQKEVEEYEAFLRAMPQDDFAVLLADERRREGAERIAIIRKEEADRLYNRPDAQADFKHWAKQSYWTVEEAVSLSFGKNPKVVHWDRLKSFTQIWPFAREYEGRLDQFNRAVWAKQIWSHTYPNLLLAWAARMGFEMPQQLVAEVEALGLQIADWKTHSDRLANELRLVREQLDEVTARNAELSLTPISTLAKTEDVAFSEKGRGTFQKMILGMALEQYGYDPTDAKSDVPKAIAGDLALHGLNLTERTIRDQLRAAAERFPEEERIRG